MPFFFGAAFFFAAFLVAFFIDRFSLDIKICDLKRSQCDSYIRLFRSKVKKKMHEWHETCPVSTARTWNGRIVFAFRERFGLLRSFLRGYDLDK